MKLTETHLLSDLLKITNQYHDYKRIYITKKIQESSKSIKMKNEDKYNGNFIDDEEMINDFNTILGMVEPKKLLIVTENENVVYEFSYDGNIAKFNTVVWMYDTTFRMVIEFETSQENRKPQFTHLDIETSEKGKKLLGKPLLGNDDFTITDFLITQHFFIIKYIIFIELSKDKVSYKTILPKSNTGHILKGNLFKNETKYSITQVDSLWEVESVSLGEFKVRGHFRLQRCGVGLSEIKLIYINEFKKTQYIRTRTRDLTFSE